MSWANYDDAKTQLTDAGLIIDKPLELDARIQRWQVDGEDREKRGWSKLREWQSMAGSTFIVGAFGVWRGNDDGYTKIELSKQCDACGAKMSLKDKTCPACKVAVANSFTAEDQEAIKAANREAAKKVADLRKAEVKRAASWAESVWGKCAPCDAHEYLERKQIKPHGLRMLPDDVSSITLAGIDDSNFFRLKSAAGALVVPMHDAKGAMQGLQFIYAKGHPRRVKIERDKEFWPSGMAMGGTFGMVGPIKREGVMLIAEGYATAASLHEATGQTVAYAFAANNLLKAGKQLNKEYPRLRFLFCADDDYIKNCTACKKPTLTESPICSHCGAKHLQENTGAIACSAATAEIERSAWVKPIFPKDADGRDLRDGKKLTDFNDLLVMTGLPLTLADQINAKLSEMKWSDSVPRGEPATKGGGESVTLKPLITIDEAAGRFALIYGMGGKSLFDFQECRVVHKDEMLNITPGRAWDDIKRHPNWRVYRDTEVGFDPDKSQPEIMCNLYKGWPTIPKKGRCQSILDLFKYLCSHETTYAESLFDWGIKWLAYSVQNPGAKMQTALIVHGDQGAGKNTFFSKAYRPIFGGYGVEFGQTAMEEKFNGWMSGILFGIGNEVIASREELYHVKGKIKNMITEPSWQIRSMHQDARMERNCCNFVFFSNDLNALHLDPKDRRFCVVWTPPTPQPDENGHAEFKAMMQGVYEELANEGSAALHDYLLRVDLDGFGVSTPPPMTDAKESLIELNLDSKERFYREWMAGNIGAVPCVPIAVELMYEFYRDWCGRSGIRNPAPIHTLTPVLYKKPHVKKEQTLVLSGSKKERKTIIYISGITDPPPDKTKVTWLGECENEFKEAIKVWKGE